MIPSGIMPTYLLLLFEITIFRNSIQSGTEFLLSMTKIPSDDILEGLYQLIIRESAKLKTVLEFYDLEIHQKKAGLDFTQIKNYGEKEVSSKIYEIGILRPETEIMKETPWLRIRGQNSVDKEFLEIVGNGKPTGSVPKETIAVSVTISISVQK